MRARIFFSGVVQGVGFRYTAQMYARRRALTGWVKNLPDGRVEMMAEGDPQEIEGLCRDLESHFGRYIRAKDASYDDTQSRYNNFSVHY